MIQIPSGSHNDVEETFRSWIPPPVDNDDLLPQEFITSDANDNSDDQAEATAATRIGWFWSSNKYKWLAALVLCTTIVCALAAGGSSIKGAHEKKRSNAVDLKTSYGDYGPSGYSKPTEPPEAAPSHDSGCPDGERRSGKSSKSSKAPTTGSSKSSKCGSKS